MLPKQKESPILRANWLSRIFFSWLLPLFWKGLRDTLKLEDLYRNLPHDSCEQLTKRLSLEWDKELGIGHQSHKKRFSITWRKKPSLLLALTRVFGKEYGKLGLFAFIEECIIVILQPICLYNFLQYFNPENYGSANGYLWGICVLLLIITYTTMDHPFTFACEHVSMRVRIALSGLLYQKALRVKQYSLEETTVGTVVNFLSGDMNRFDNLMTFMHYLWIAPIQLIEVLTILWLYLDVGKSSMAGMLFVLFFAPIQGIFARMFGKLREKMAANTDKRLLATDELISSIRVIKMYTWEDAFSKKINSARDLELKYLRKTATYEAINASLFTISSRVILFFILVTFVLGGNSLTSEIVFVTFSLLNSVEKVLGLFFPLAISSFAEVLASLHRFEKFLLLEELHTPVIDDRQYESQHYLLPPDRRFSRPQTPETGSRDKFVESQDVSVKPSLLGKRTVVYTKGLRAQWNPETYDYVLDNFSIDVKEGEIVAIIGPVGAGKTSVLQALMYELPPLDGKIFVKGTVAYVSQEPWIFDDTIRENIIFGREYDEVWYTDVVEACALTMDLNLLPHGDLTVVGEKGLSLSGGQRARINLARAVYSKSDIYLLDAPLAAVDAQVSRHILEKCILGILKNKTRILITSQIQYLKPMNEVIVLVDGKIIVRGKYDEVVQSGVEIGEIMKTHSCSIRCNSRGDLIPRINSIAFRNSLHNSTTAIDNYVLENPEVGLPEEPMITESKKELQQSTPDELTPLEEMQRGNVQFKTYWSYLYFGGGCFKMFIVFLLFILTQGLVTCTDYFLKYWVSVEQDKSRENSTNNSSNQDTNNTAAEEKRPVLVLAYTVLIGVLFLIVLLRTLGYYRMCMASSYNLHEKMLASVVRSPMAFFETNPLGRILNRFAKDISVVDDQVPYVFYDVLDIFLRFAGILVIIGSSSAIMLAPAAVLIVVFYLIRKFYFYTATSIKRLEAVARSPVFTHLSNTLYGLTSIRSYGMEDTFLQKFYALMDVHSSTWYLFLATARWFGVVIDWTSVVFISIVIFNFVAAPDRDNPNYDAVVGLTVTSALMLASMLQWGIRQSADLACQMISVERALEYCKLPSEAPYEDDKHKPHKDWLQDGYISIKNVSLRYRENLPVLALRNIFLSVQAREKIGIVGRTGAGKSSIISAIFRLVEPCTGSITIDNINTRQIGLKDLRSKISIIPQEPVVFVGTMRNNLDPYDYYHDDELWDVLKETNLDDAIRDSPKGLETEIMERGSNLSLGQKQLLCLARAILKKNRIVILDEATASLDEQTDSLLQRSIRDKFRRSTVLTIAHRLSTVMDYDKIAVLDTGKIIEFDEPNVLLKNKSSALYKLVEQTGKESSKLREIASQAAMKRNQNVTD